MTGWGSVVLLLVLPAVAVFGILERVTESPAITVRAGICTNADCSKRGTAGFEPVKIAVEARVRHDDRNRKLFIGVSCDGGLDSDPSEIDLDGEHDHPFYTRAYAGMPPGECIGWAAVVRSDGTRDIAMSTPMLVLPR